MTLRAPSAVPPFPRANAEAPAGTARPPALPRSALGRGAVAVLLCALALSAGSTRGAPAELPAGPVPSPLTLDEARALAEKHSPHLEAARHERRAAEIALERERPAFRPTLNLKAGETLQGPKVTFPRFDERVTVVPTSRAQVGVTAQQTLFRFGAGAAGDRYEALRDAAAQTYEGTRRTLAYDVAQAYYKLAGAREMAGVARQGLELAEAHVKLVETLLEGRAATRADLLRAQAEAAEARQGVLTAENGVALATANLERLLGTPLPPGTVVAPTTISEPPEPEAPDAGASNAPAEPDMPERELQEAIRRAQEERPEVLALQDQLKAAEAGVSLAKGQGLPSLQLDGALSRQTPSAFIPSTTWSAGVSVTLPLLDGGKTRTDVAEARARVDQIKASLRELREGVALEVRQAWMSLQEARARRRVASRAVAAAQEAYDIALLRYQAGAGLNLEVLDARLALTRARANHVQAGLDMLLAASDLRYRSGD